MRLNRPYGVAFDRDGDMFIADTHNHRILRCPDKSAARGAAARTRCVRRQHRVRSGAADTICTIIRSGERGSRRARSTTSARH
jgi:sugar lactone lactonase YvrE